MCAHRLIAACPGTCQPVSNYSQFLLVQSGTNSRAGTVIGISGTKTADEDCVLGAEQFFWEDTMGLFPFLDPVGMPHAILWNLLYTRFVLTKEFC